MIRVQALSIFLRGGRKMDYNEFRVRPEEMKFKRANAEQKRVLNMINVNSKAGMVIAMVMCAILGIIVSALFFALVHWIAGVVALVLVAVMSFFTYRYLLKIFDAYHNFELVPVELVTGSYKKGERWAVDLWSESQQKCVQYILIRDNNHVKQGAKGFFVKAISDKRTDYLLVTEDEYKIMQMNVEKRHRARRS